MDIDKLIENAKACCGDIDTDDCTDYCINPRDKRGEDMRFCRQWLVHDLHTAISSLRAENDNLRAENSMLRKMQPVELDGEATQSLSLAVEISRIKAELEKERAHRLHAEQHADAFLKDCERINANLEQVKRERDAAVEAVKNMAEYIVCAGCVDYFLCDEISQEHHLKYQPKNDGDYDDGPCCECVKDWFLKGNKWGED